MPAKQTEKVMLKRNMRHRVWPLLKDLGGDVGLPGLFGLPDKGDLRAMTF